MSNKEIQDKKKQEEQDNISKLFTMWPIPNYTRAIIEWVNDPTPIKTFAIEYINFTNRRTKDATT